MIIPTISPEIDTWCSPYFSAVGKSSSNEMYHDSRNGSQNDSIN